MRTTGIFTALFCICSSVVASSPQVSSDDLLQRGQDNYRSGHYAEAISDLRAASDAFLTPEQMRAYVNTGRFESLPKFETAVIFLAISYARLGRDAEASEQIHRLNVAEAIAPIYAKLPLTAEVADFEQVVARVAPAVQLPPNVALAARRSATTTTTQVAQAAPASTPSPAPQAPPAPQAAPAEQRTVEERVAADRAAIEKAALERIAAADAAAQAAANEKVATERAAAQKAADERVAAATAAAQQKAEQQAEQQIAEARAAANRSADERIAAGEAAAQKAADERVAAERATIEKQTEERIAAERAKAEREAAARIAAADAEARRNVLAMLRQADTLANTGETDQADAIYVRLANGANASREAITAAAIGLYRTSDFADAVNAFQRLNSFARGEEDLRYYHAVALYETGHYDQARKELACALPYIQATDDVTRYRAKIEQMAGRQAMK